LRDAVPQKIMFFYVPETPPEPRPELTAKPARGIDKLRWGRRLVSA
jgi:hypothetical protein